MALMRKSGHIPKVHLFVFEHPSQASLIKQPRLSADPLVWHNLEALVTTQLYHPSPGLGDSLNSDKRLLLQLVLVMLQPALP